ncbi:MAG TPA: efflux RND transporter periplasmic adaptor subunit [Vicinamibacterales bacterium]|nr:efflux RND transporter periplasmic adaptor subunit [Vicinamibacterales bacterium]
MGGWWRAAAPTWVLAAALCVFAAAATACRRQRAVAQQDEGPTPVPVAAQPVETGTLRTLVRATGLVVPAEGAEFLVFAPEPARLVEVTKQKGDAVRSGEPLVRFDLPLALQELARQRAELARAESTAENARTAAARMREFADRGLVPRRDLDVAERELADATAALERVRRQYAAAEAAAARTIVRAPFDGVVLERFHEPGDLVQAAATDPVLRIADPRRIEVMAHLPPGDLPRIVPGAAARMPHPADGTPVRLTVAGPAPRRGGTTAPSTAPDNSVPVRLAFVDPVTVPIDTTVQVEIEAGERTGVLLVPAEAVIHENGRTFVMVADGNRASRRTVTTGAADDTGRVEIVEGVRPGELVITRGHVGLDDGALVTVARP